MYQLQLAAAEWSAGEYMVAEYCPMVCYGYPMAVKAFEGGIHIISTYNNIHIYCIWYTDQHLQLTRRQAKDKPHTDTDTPTTENISKVVLLLLSDYSYCSSYYTLTPTLLQHYYTTNTALQRNARNPCRACLPVKATFATMGASQSTTYALGDDVGLNHFTLGRVVGKGAFGKVRIVEHKYTKLTFALKYIRKDDIVRTESVRNIIRERRMLEHLNHPFICNLRYSFQDTQYMYLVVDLMSGGDLRFHIARKAFTEDAVKFWIAELGCALRYIHKQGIIHRDVKPDNVLLDSEGHIHLADFNVASDYTPGKPLTSKSGSQPYLSPEVWAGTGYGPAADWWSLGVLFYECIYNKRPFDTHSAKGLGELIMNANPSFPVTSPPVTMPCMHAVSSALEPDPTKRLGATWQSFIDNPFFRSVDFEALERKEIEPVFVPSKDKTNFDATYDLEELLLEEAPLEARTRRQKPREPLAEGATDKEIREDELYRMIETGFMPFDYTLAAYNRYQEADEAAYQPRPPAQSSTT
ncbi:hypothetical protein O988_08187, partial [Pseudogymnoascus sp. VKM F-3808]